uniref:Uncharacterized protein n=1 Tax=Vitis vinifera TaxID=29760 RepID=F6HJG4_VITVI
MLQRRRIYQVDVLVNEKRIRRKRHGTTGGNRERSDPGKIGDRNQWWVHRAHGLAHWFKSHLTPSPPSAFPSWVPLDMCLVE